MGDDHGSMTRHPALFLGVWKHLETACADRLAELRESDPLRPLTIVCGSSAAASHLRRRVTRAAGGLVAVEFTTIHRLAAAASAATLRQQCLRPLADVEALRLIAGVIAAGANDSYYARVSEMPGLPRALRRTFKDLRESCVGADELLTLPGPGPRALAALYRAYIDGLDRVARADDATMYLAASESVSSDPRSVPATWIGFYGLYDLPETQRRFVQALAAGREFDAFVPGPPDQEYSSGVRDLFTKMGCEPSLLSGFGEHERGVMPPPSPLGDDSQEVAVEVVSVEDASAERREVLRRVMAAAETGRRFHEIAVVHADSAWRGLFVEDLEARGVPVAARVRRVGVVARAMSALLACVVPQSGVTLERAVTIDLASACAMLGSCDARAVVRWDRLSRDARVTGGPQQWHARVPGAATRSRSHEASADARALLSFVDRIDLLRDAALACCTWPALVGWLERALESLGAPPDDLAFSALHGLIDIGAIEPHVTLEVFVSVVSEVVAETSDVLGSLARSGVAVVAPEELRGVRLPVLFFAGLVEGLFPPRPTADPLLGDDERAELAAKTGAALSTTTLRAQESDVLFALTRTAAEETLVLFRARSKDGTGAAQLPSRHLLSLCEELAGHSLAFSAVDTQGAVGGRVTRIAASTEPHAAWPGDVRGADEREVDVAAVAGLEACGDQGRIDAYLGTVLGSAAASRRLKAQRSRKEPRLTAWDGVIRDSRLAAEVLTRELSVSAIEDYLDCPFIFFARHVLRASAVEEPEDALESRALDVGLLVHQVLERVFSAVCAVTPYEPAAALDALGAIIDEVFGRGELEGVTGYPLAWRGRRRQLADDLRRAVAEDPSWTDLLRPELFEWSFGRDSPGPSVVVGGRRLAFRGRVDRIDRGADAAQVRLIDYKTGKGKTQLEALKSGEDIQLPVYRLAAAALQPPPAEVSCIFRLVTRAGDFHDLALEGSAEATTAALLLRLSVFVAGVESGLFVRSHGGSRCRWCDLSYACGARTPRDDEKQADPRLTAGAHVTGEEQA